MCVIELYLYFLGRLGLVAWNTLLGDVLLRIFIASLVEKGFQFIESSGWFLADSWLVFPGLCWCVPPATSLWISWQRRSTRLASRWFVCVPRAARPSTPPCPSWPCTTRSGTWTGEEWGENLHFWCSWWAQLRDLVTPAPWFAWWDYFASVKNHFDCNPTKLVGL